MSFFWIALFGALGALTRFCIGLLVERHLSPDLPIATLGINVTGSFLIGFLLTLSLQSITLSPELRLGIVVGFLGSFTTFSTFSLEVVKLFERDSFALGVGYLFVSPILSILATLLGIRISRLVQVMMN
jgi:CrcB protein